MNLQDYLVSNYAVASAGQSQQSEREPDRGNNDSLEELIHQKSRILGKKLDILAAEIWWRLNIAARNLASINQDKALIEEMIGRLHLAALYHLREHQDKGIFYRKLFDFQTEARSEQVECWRDVVMIMRDFLMTWEAHEQAKARAIFIQNVGTGT
jgi:hypothetical protein